MLYLGGWQPGRRADSCAKINAHPRSGHWQSVGRSVYRRREKEELGVFDFIKWLNDYYLVSFNCFPLFLHLLISLIELIIWLKFFHRQKARVRTWGEIHRVWLCFTSSFLLGSCLLLDTCHLGKNLSKKWPCQRALPQASLASLPTCM